MLFSAVCPLVSSSLRNADLLLPTESGQLNSELCVSCGCTREEVRNWRGMKRPDKMDSVQKAAARVKVIKKYF